jgi:hypothetical protein
MSRALLLASITLSSCAALGVVADLATPQGGWTRTIQEILNVDPAGAPLPTGPAGTPVDPLAFRQILAGISQEGASTSSQILLGADGSPLRQTASQAEREAATKTVTDRISGNIQASLASNLNAMPGDFKLILETTSKRASTGFLNPVLRGFYKGVNETAGRSVFDVDSEIQKWSVQTGRTMTLGSKP